MRPINNTIQFQKITATNDDWVATDSLKFNSKLSNGNWTSGRLLILLLRCTNISIILLI